MKRSDYIAAAGVAMIAFAMLAVFVSGRSAEAFKHAVRADCAAAISVAAQIRHVDCHAVLKSGEDQVAVAMCRVTNGWAVEQIASAPHCKIESEEFTP